MNKLRILLISTSYPIRQDSISGIFVKKLAENLVEYADITVLTPDDNIKEPLHEDDKINLIAFKYAPKKIQLLAHNPGGIPAKLRKRKTSIFLVPFFIGSMIVNIINQAKHHDIIFCNWAISGFIASFFISFFKKPIVTTLRGEDISYKPNKLSSFILERCLKYSERVVLVSSEMQDRIAARYPQYSSKLLTIYNGIDPVFASEKPISVITEGTPLMIISVGNLIPRKNNIFVLEALKLLEKHGIEFEYRIVGNGEELHKLKVYAKHNLKKNKIIFMGEKSPEIVAEQLVKSHIFITSSIHEGRPNAVIEAMASGLCILASDISGHRELIKDIDPQFLFELSNPQFLTNRLIYLANNPSKIASCGKSAQETILSKGNNWNKCAENYLNLFNTVLSNARSYI